MRHTRLTQTVGTIINKKGVCHARNRKREKKKRVVKYLKSLLKSIESDEIEIKKCDVTEGNPNSDSESFDIKIEMSVTGFTVPLYNFLSDE